MYELRTSSSDYFGDLIEPLRRQSGPLLSEHNQSLLASNDRDTATRHEVTTTAAALENTQMMEYSGLGKATSHASDLEPTVVASTFVQDIHAVLAATSDFSPTLSALAGRATEALNLALRDAAGHPNDDRWSDAYDALGDFIDFYLRRSDNRRAIVPLTRLSSFLAENSDLADAEPNRSNHLRRPSDPSAV